MADLCIAAAIMTLAGIAAGWLAQSISRRYGRRVAVGVVLAAIAGLLINGFVLNDNPAWTRVFPSPAIMIYGNLALPFAGLLIGAAWHSLTTPPWQRLTLLVPLALLGYQRTLWHVLRPPPTLLASTWQSGVCRQSTQSTCSPAAAATALAVVGIQTDEAEMATLCRTTIGGTTSLGLYRGLLLKTRGTPVELHVFRTIDDLLNAPPGPAVVNLRLLAVESSNPLWALLGGRPGDGHSVVILSRTEDGRFHIGDPLSGLQT